ncbi:hypothetical protein JJC00_08600 [Bradyrhizobium diazoefficiens]|uniref:hypothetical protein n=1 Tax=Bradyrhizobium diazoefficiens TaxID=1355477 RepID=UPI00190A7154|nr:hypothetical protein [Bradyrhizobium diazoefficiens]QQO35625.1 hypothetical protein JJC00_08600 [Bradyrhizobium diazoefficiens]
MSNELQAKWQVEVASDDGEAPSARSADVKAGARYDHNYLALPAVMTGENAFWWRPEIVVSDLVRGGVLHLVPGSRAASGMQYRAYAVDRSDKTEIARAFLPLAVRLCKKAALLEAA